MFFNSLVEGPLLWMAFLIFAVGMIARVVFFSYAIIRSNETQLMRWGDLLTTYGRSFLPFHRAAMKRPVYSALRYVFHVILMVVPIWLGGHIALWEESRFEWSWIPLPDAWADWMTIIFLTLTAYFLIRRIFLPEIRLGSTTADFLFIVITALPFVTGYFYTHGTLDAIPFLGNNMGTLHVLSGEAMLVAVVFLFCRTRLKGDRCTGCAACELSCPTGTLQSDDEGKNRIFRYSLYQCICCGACVNICPEEAAELRHEISLNRFFRLISKESIGTVARKVCEQCGAVYAPEPLLEKIEGLALMITDDYIQFCPDCRKSNYGNKVKTATG